MRFETALRSIYDPRTNDIVAKADQEASDFRKWRRGFHSASGTSDQFYGGSDGIPNWLE